MNTRTFPYFKPSLRWSQFSSNGFVRVYREPNAFLSNECRTWIVRNKDHMPLQYARSSQKLSLLDALMISSFVNRSFQESHILRYASQRFFAFNQPTRSTSTSLKLSLSNLVMTYQLNSVPWPISMAFLLIDNPNEPVPQSICRHGVVIVSYTGEPPLNHCAYLKHVNTLECPTNSWNFLQGLIAQNKVHFKFDSSPLHW